MQEETRGSHMKLIVRFVLRKSALVGLVLTNFGQLHAFSGGDGSLCPHDGCVAPQVQEVG
jgi:hypothetical protein